jgi:hypothetical protein
VGTLGFESSAFRVRFQCQGCGKILTEDKVAAHKEIHGLVINIGVGMFDTPREAVARMCTLMVPEETATNMVSLAKYMSDHGHPIMVVTKNIDSREVKVVYNQQYNWYVC